MDDDVEAAIATARAFQQRAGAQRVVLLLDRGEGEPVMIDCELLIEVTDGESVTTMAEPSAAPRPLPEIRPTPATAISIDIDSGELAAPLGTIEHLAQAVLALASTFGGLTVATAEFPTRDPELPITLAAREGERVVLGAGDAQYEL